MGAESPKRQIPNNPRERSGIHMTNFRVEPIPHMEQRVSPHPKSSSFEQNP